MYRIRFINESRTTLKYKIIKDATKILKELATSCGDKNVTSYVNLKNRCIVVYEKLYRNNNEEELITSVKSSINDEYYEIIFILQKGDYLDIGGYVSFDKKKLVLKCSVPDKISFEDYFNDGTFIYYFKKTLIHEISHVYDKEPYDTNEHYSNFLNQKEKTPIFYMYYLTSDDEIKAFLSETFSLCKRKNRQPIQILEFLISGYFTDDKYIKFVVKFILSKVIHDKLMFKRFQQMFVNTKVDYFSNQFLTKIRKIMFQSLSKNKQQDLLNNRKFQQLIS